MCGTGRLGGALGCRRAGPAPPPQGVSVSWGTLAPWSEHGLWSLTDACSASTPCITVSKRVPLSEPPRPALGHGDSNSGFLGVVRTFTVPSCITGQRPPQVLGGVALGSSPLRVRVLTELSDTEQLIHTLSPGTCEWTRRRPPHPSPWPSPVWWYLHTGIGYTLSFSGKDTLPLWSVLACPPPQPTGPFWQVQPKSPQEGPCRGWTLRLQ